MADARRTCGERIAAKGLVDQCQAQLSVPHGIIWQVMAAQKQNKTLKWDFSQRSWMCLPKFYMSKLGFKLMLLINTHGSTHNILTKLRRGLCQIG